MSYHKKEEENKTKQNKKGSQSMLEGGGSQIGKLLKQKQQKKKKPKINSVADNIRWLITTNQTKPRPVASLVMVLIRLSWSKKYHTKQKTEKLLISPNSPLVPRLSNPALILVFFV